MLKILKAAVIASLVLGAALLALGVLARWYPALDIINNGLPVLAVGGIALLALAFAVQNRTLIATATFMAVTLALLLSGLSGAAPQAPDGAARFLRVATFNLWGRNDHHLNQVAAFLAETKADAVVLEEVRGHHKDFLESLAGQYPYRVGDNGLAILSKHPIVVDGAQVELAGVHLARPFYPDLQEADIVALATFVQERTGPLIVAGDFNMAP
jgi:endonuclease/exonuclease/phosphatase (EEP) superfamily protein YafD